MFEHSTMRIHGTLTKWNDDRGFGFITPANGSPDIFVHISAFPRDGVRPRLNELISFEVETKQDGKRRAVRVMRPGKKKATLPRPPRDHARSHGSRTGRAITLLAIVALGAYGYSEYTKRALEAQILDAQTAAPEVGSDAIFASPPSPHACDGRTMCSQMTSCAEATYFIRNCPNTRMDGDGDGVPCERQFCN